MRDTELYFHLLGLVKPWTVGNVELSVPNRRVDVAVEHPVGLFGAVRSVPLRVFCTITATSGRGDISIAASSRRTCGHGFRASNVRRTEYSRCLSRGLNRAADSHSCLSGLPSRSCCKGVKKEPLEEYIGSFPLSQRESVRAVALDMCDTFYAAIAEVIPESWNKIVYDRFHVMQHVSKAVEKIRKQEHAFLLRTSDQRLSGTRILWSYSDENLPEDRREQLEKRQAEKLVTGRAWALKEFLRTRWNCPSRSTAVEVWNKWYCWAQRSRLEPMKDVARRLRARLYNILTFARHRINNATSEGLNSAISTLIRRAYGYRNLQNQITAIYFYHGGLNLLPEPVTHGELG